MREIVSSKKLSVTGMAAYRTAHVIVYKARMRAAFPALPLKWNRKSIPFFSGIEWWKISWKQK